MGLQLVAVKVESLADQLVVVKVESSVDWSVAGLGGLLVDQLVSLKAERWVV